MLYVQHMDDHSEDLRKYKFSNNMVDCCKTSCKLCGKQFSLQRMRSHTKNDHGMQITEYKTKFNQFFFDIVETVFHRYFFPAKPMPVGRTIRIDCTACTALHYTALYYTVLHCTTPHYTAIHCTTLHYTVLHCSVLHCTIPGVVSVSYQFSLTVILYLLTWEVTR